MKTINILGVNIHAITRNQAEKEIQAYLFDNKTRIIVTPGPEFLVRAHKNPDFKELLNRADLALADGSGLVFFSGGNIPERCSGADMIPTILKQLQHNSGKLGVILRDDGLSRADKLMHSLEKTNPGLHTKIVYKKSNETISKKILRDLTDFIPDVLLVALGSPQQEEWIFAHQQQFPQTKIMMGVGGALDYWSGAMRRAPRFMRNIGLEWLWRLIRQPRRLPRILNAVILFPLLVIAEKSHKKHYE